MSEFKIKCKKGIDDLESVYAFIGNSQGDESKSNLIADYENSKGWMSFIYNCDLDQEAINKETRRRILWNYDYIRRLYEEGKFGEEYELSIKLEYNPLFDNSYNPLLDGSNRESLSSYRIIFLDPKDTEE